VHTTFLAKRKPDLIGSQGLSFLLDPEAAYRALRERQREFAKERELAREEGRER
jgi:hypothetical protein